MRLNEMFIIVLKFSDNKNRAPEFMQGHNDWIKQGFDDNVFVLVGSLKPNLGGCIMAHNAVLEELQLRINKDPFVEQNIVSAEILQVSANQATEQLEFLMD